MRLFLMILFFTVLTVTCGEPEPKKFKTDFKEKEKKLNSTLTEDEKKFLREVEAKFGVKTELDSKKEENKVNVKQGLIKPFPAVIAIEIVNDTDVTSKDKRTIDANLGYGYKTNNGYSYSYFGKPAKEKGKFMIYPYSQEDIPAPPNHAGGYNNGGRYTTVTTSVDIQPSRAFELVTVKDERESYTDKKPGFGNNYFDNVKGLVSPPPAYSQKEYADNTHTPHQSTLYTTYNGEGFSGLSGQFPMVMSNYFINPSQLLKQPEYQSAGLTTDHLHSLQGSSVDQRVVPVLVLRIPSSSLKNPTAELFANLPDNYPLSNYLNNVNLQNLVNEYFKKFGYSYAPQVMTYKDSVSLSHSGQTSVPGTSNEPQNYAVPYVQPSYTHADYSGVQYSAVKPVMARYPSSYTRQRYYPSHGHSLYHQPLHQQNYEYQYVSQTPVSSQMHYVQPQYQQQSHQSTSQEVDADHSSHQETSYQDTSTEVHYEIPSLQHTQHDNTDTRALEYRHPHVNIEANYETNTAVPEYGVPKENTRTVTSDYERIIAPVYGVPNQEQTSQEYYTSQQENQKETISKYPSQEEQTVPEYYSQSNSGESQAYTYQQQTNEHDTNEESSTPHYPSHTIATVLPLRYKTEPSQPTVGAVQTVSYVTPMPYSYKYQSPFRVMVPQTYLTNPVNEKVSYVNSQPMSSSYLQTGHQTHIPEEEYTASSQYISAVGKQKPSYPRNYHSHPKRMIRPESKHNEKSEKKRTA